MSPAALWLTAWAALNLLTFALYARDKHAARTGQWRTPENTLHLLSLLGGWPAAWVAQRVLRHKTSKRSFQLVFWLTVVVNLTGVGAYAFLHSAKTLSIS
ncbi:DUF1294 domain-containing protein [Rhodoferax saidenbachensis]|uniref:Uncharacterized membrane protein YsdA (DUF1294 family) n=1 Tax=Rhodoferax saidenbachensis TaxID=1484693 RepID=A0ABU1ZHS4_9BURK|nr:uncharacterized membrane protein YsdA (DUF1294 family) [Rhodoferax saidenbachensis]